MIGVMGPSGASIPGWMIVRPECGLNDRQIARYLGVSLSTVRRWNRTDNVPRAVLLALFWQTRYGRSEMETSEANWVAQYYAESQGHKREIVRLRAVIEKLEAERKDHVVPANSPFYRAM